MYRRIFVIFLISKILFFSFVLVGDSLIQEKQGYLAKNEYPEISENITRWANLDGRHFLDIAENGYRGTNFAFFPLYPLFIKILGDITGINKPLTGIIISLFTQYLSLVFLFKITSLDLKKSNAFWTVIFACFFSFSYYYQSVYADSLFFLLSILAFYFIRKDKWVVGGVWGALAILTRLSGIALIPAFAIEWFYSSRKNKKDIILSVAILSSTLIGYMLYQKYFFGDALLFQKSMSSWNQEQFVFPLQVFWRYIKIFLTVNPGLFVFWIAVLEFVAFVFYLILTLICYKRLRISYAVFMLILLLLVPFTGTFAGTPRYLLHLFPGFIALTILFNKKAHRYLFLIVSIALGAVFVVLFTQGYFVT